MYSRNGINGRNVIGMVLSEDGLQHRAMGRIGFERYTPLTLVDHGALPLVQAFYGIDMNACREPLG